MAKKIINVVYNVNDSELTRTKSTIQGLEKETKDAEKEMLKLGRATQQAGNAGYQSFLNFKNVLGAIGFAGVTASVIMLGKKIFDLGVKQEQTNIAFTTFLGSAEKAKKVIADLTKFSIITPFTPDQVNKAAQTLLAFGVQSEELIPILKMLGDVSSGTGKDLSEMAVIFGQIRSTGRLMGQDLLQLINAGFNPLQIISQKTGKSMRDLKADMEKGLISFDMVSDAFKTATSEGGLFFNLMEKQSQSIGGIMSTISGNIDEGLKNIFKANSGPLKEFVDNLATISEAFLEWSKSTEQVGEEIASLSLDKFRTRLSEISTQLKTNNKEMQNVAIAAQNAFAVDVVDAINQVNTELENFDQKFIENKEDITKATIDGNKVLLAESQKNTIELNLRKAVLEAEKKGLEGVRDELFLLTAGEKQVTEETKKTNKELQDRAKALAAINKQLGIKSAVERVKEKEEKAEKEAKRQSDAIDREIEQNERRAAVLKANDADMEAERVRMAEEAAEERIRIAEEEAARKDAAIQRSYDLAIQLGASLLENFLMESQVNTQAIRDKYDEEIRLAGDNDKAKEQIELERDKKLRQAEIRNKQIQKQNARTKILIDTSVAIIKTFAEFGYPAGIIPAALMGGIGALQLANVRKYKKGEVNIDGPGNSTSDSIPAMLSKGESVINAKATAQSRNLLEAINERKIDDKILSQVARNGGSQVNVFDDNRIVEAIHSNRVDYEKHAYTLMQVNKSGKNFKRIIRAKVQGY